MPTSTFCRGTLAAGLLVAVCATTGSPASAAGPGRFCGGAATPGDAGDSTNVVGDLSLEYAVQQPASMVTCAQGYFLEKCGDHENAHKIFDKCIAAGYVGAMIWKALLLEDGSGVAQDLAKAAELLRRAATSGDPAYGALGKMHYATALYLGRGVEKNEAEAMEWFRAAAAEGDEDAQEFLRTGYHSGYRDVKTAMGAGTPTATALAGAPAGDNASLPPRIPAPVASQEVRAIGLVKEPVPEAPPPEPRRPAAASTAPAPLDTEVQGQKLERRDPAAPPRAPSASAGVALLLLASFLAGVFRKRHRSRRDPARLQPL